GVAGYRVYRDGTQIGQTATTTYPVSGLSCGSSYTLAVEAYDAAGNSSTRPTLPAATVTCPVAPAPPSVASLTFVSPTATTVSGWIRWEFSSPVLVNRIDFSIDGGGVRWSEGQAPYVFNGDTGRLDTTTLTDGTHTLKVDGFDAAGTRVATASR